MIAVLYPALICQPAFQVASGFSPLPQSCSLKNHIAPDLPFLPETAVALAFQQYAKFPVSFPSPELPQKRASAFFAEALHWKDQV